MSRSINSGVVDLRFLSGTEGEKSRVLEIYGECAEFFNLYKNSDATERDVESLFNEMPQGKSAQDKEVYGIFVEGSMAGVIDLIHDYPQKGTGFIGLFLLKGSLQRQGLGKKAWLALEDLFKFQEFRLVVVSTNIKAFAFWYAMGFQETGKRTNYTHGAFSGIKVEMVKPGAGLKHGQPE
jgi:ribosomal protein S18 acetylase RimI-like enzyme